MTFQFSISQSSFIYSNCKNSPCQKNFLLVKFSALCTQFEESASMSIQHFIFTIPSVNKHRYSTSTFAHK